MNSAYTYKNVALIPNLSELTSRNEADISISFLGKKFKAPWVPANMASVINEDICKWLSFNGYFYIMHRFGNTKSFIQRARAEAWPMVSISVGVKDIDRELILDIKESKCRVDYICIDIAHGYSTLMKNMISFIKENLPDTRVIAGNVWGDKKSILALESWGADAIKVGLSYGAGCTTFSTTGFGSPMFTAALHSGGCANVPVILDGGVRESADIAKAIVGFTCGQYEQTFDGFSGMERKWKNPINVPMVMAGSIFAACIDAPGEDGYETVNYSDLKFISDSKNLAEEFGVNVPKLKLKVAYKKYYGSASAENKSKTGQVMKNIEGKSVTLECNGMTYSEKYESLTQALRSSVSYAGGKNLLSLANVDYVLV